MSLNSVWEWMVSGEFVIRSFSCLKLEWCVYSGCFYVDDLVGVGMKLLDLKLYL